MQYKNMVYGRLTPSGCEMDRAYSTVSTTCMGRNWNHISHCGLGRML